MTVLKAFLAIKCPAAGVIEFKKCKACEHKNYESMTEYVVECNIENFGKSLEKISEKFSEKVSGKIFPENSRNRARSEPSMHARNAGKRGAECALASGARGVGIASMVTPPRLDLLCAEKFSSTRPTVVVNYPYEVRTPGVR